MNETVWMASGTHRNRDSKYHTDRDCRRLAVASTVVTEPLDAVRNVYGLCSVCAGLADFGGQDRGHYQALLRAARDA